MKKFLLAVGMFVGFMAGLFFQKKVLDTPDTVVNNQYDKIKNKGSGEQNTHAQTDIKQETDRRKVRLRNRINNLNKKLWQ